MFDIGWGELLVIGVVALVAIGPKELPGVLRMVGQWVGKIRHMAAEFQGQFQEAIREAEMADVKRQMDEVTRELTSHYDPLEPVHKELERASDVSTPAPAASEPSSTPPAEANSSTAAAPEPDLPVDVSEPAPLDPAAPAADADPAQAAQTATTTQPEPRLSAGGSGSA